MVWIREGGKLLKIERGTEIRDTKGRKRKATNIYYGRYGKEKGLMYAVFEGPVLREALDKAGRRMRKIKKSGTTEEIR